jgi:hypothetical protein
MKTNVIRLLITNTPTKYSWTERDVDHDYAIFLQNSSNSNIPIFQKYLNNLGIFPLEQGSQCSNFDATKLQDWPEILFSIENFLRNYSHDIFFPDISIRCYDLCSELGMKVNWIWKCSSITRDMNYWIENSS